MRGRIVMGAVGGLVGLAVAVASANAAPRWSEGGLATEIQNINCPSLILGSGYPETEVGAYLGQYVDDASPKVGEVFDVHLVVATLGNTCSGTRPKLELALPPGVTPAVGGGHTIRCYLRSSGSQPFGAVSTAEGCPTVLRPGTTNHPAISQWWSLDPEPGTPAAPAWPLPQGAQLEIQVPVVGSRVMNGIGDTTGCVCAVASIQTVNGISRPDDLFSFASSSPTSGAYIPLFVFSGPASAGPTPQPGTGGEAPSTGQQVPAPGSPPIRPADGGSSTTPTSTVVETASGERIELTAPGKVTRASVRRGRLRARLAGLSAGDRVRVTLHRGRTTLATGSATAKKAKASLRLKPSKGKRARSALRRKGVAKLKVRVRRDGVTVATLSAPVNLE